MNQQLNMLNQKNEDAFGLDYLQIYNWGTYDNDIDEIRPSLFHSWLTGVNQAGKSTLIDAIATLLTPNKLRHYNMASGQKGKEERTEKTYVMGAWGQIVDEKTLASGRKYLREEEGKYTVLVAGFRTPVSGKTVSLAQVLWLQNSSISKYFVVADIPLYIDSHFSGVDSPLALKKKLRTIPGVKIRDTATEYSELFIKSFGMRSKKALELFNSAASLRDIDDLAEFIRAYMLEKPDLSKEHNSLIDMHRASSEAWTNIVKAKKQINLLESMPGDHETYLKAIDDLALLDRQDNTLKPYLSFRYVEVEEERRESHCAEKRSFEAEVDDLNDQRKQLNDKLERVIMARQKDTDAIRIDSVKNEILTLKEKGEHQQTTATHFNQDAEFLGFPGCGSKSDYTDSLKKAGELKSDLDNKIAAWDGDRVVHSGSLENRRNEFAQVMEEYNSLGTRDSNIPQRLAIVRDKVAQALELNPSSLPFAGELIEVKKEEKEWEGALERLFGGFATEVLVSDDYYEQVVRYVKKTNLGGLLKFNRVSPGREVHVQKSRDDFNFAFGKVSIKPDSPFKSWLENFLRRTKAHRCCLTPEEFMRADQGITREGLIKHNERKHIKDDRPEINNRKNYVLGWDTKLKRQALEAEAREKGSEISTLEGSIKKLSNDIKVGNDKLAASKNLLRITTFESLDVEGTKSRILGLQDHLSDLEKKNKALKVLEDQKNKLESEIQNMNESIQEAQHEVSVRTERIERCDRDIKCYREDYQKTASSDQKELFPVLNERIEKTGINITRLSFSDSFDELMKDIKSDRSEHDKSRGVSERSLLGAMRSFKHEYQESCADEEAKLEYVDSFIEKYEKLKKENLPRYEDEFRRMFTKDIVDAVTALRESYTREFESIRDAIELINKPLEDVSFRDGTRIRLYVKEAKLKVIEDFQALLRRCLSKVTDQFDEKQQLEAFEAVNELVEFLTSPETETYRAIVRDVRNWADFYAEEYVKETGENVTWYTSGRGGSGGEKARLAYTVLATSMAHQFGMTADSQTKDSFNFVMLDEAFARTDPKNSRRAIELFKKMGFQILIVSPETGSDILEPHIKSVHIAYPNSNMSKSRVYTVTIEEATKILGRPIGKKVTVDANQQPVMMV